MGVYIKGTNKNHVLKTFQSNGLSPKLMGIELIEVPEPHGRLIDAEYLEEHLYQCETNGRPLHIMELNERLACITDVPTVIEAEGE